MILKNGNSILRSNLELLVKNIYSVILITPLQTLIGNKKLETRVGCATNVVS